MQSLFKSIFSSGKTAVLNPLPEPQAEVPLEVPADLSLAPPKSSDGTAVAPAVAPSTEPKPDDEAVLQDFLLKNFLLDEQASQTSTATPEPALTYARIPDPLP